MTGAPLHGFDYPSAEQGAVQALIDRLESSIRADLRTGPKMGLRQFVREGWSLVEPRTPYIDNWHIGAICEHLEAVSSGQITDLLINIPPGCMKLCADSTPVLTPDGWRRHGDLSVGDRVFGPDGAPRVVLRTSAKAVADLDVEFTNGEVITCNGDHLWTVFDRRSRAWVTRSTRSLATTALWSGARATFQLPDAGAVAFPTASLPVPPYFFGAWLGDGTSTKPCITHDRADTAIIDRIRQDGIEPTGHYGPYPGVSSIATVFRHQGVIQRLRALGVYGNKHIPSAYKCASAEQRRALLAGLIDTDGWADKGRGRYQISTGSARLAQDIEDVAASLGWRPYTVAFSPRGYGDYRAGSDTHYQVSFSPTDAVPVALDRKRMTARARRRRVGIRAIRSARMPEVGHCITIDRPDGLYLVGRKCVVTHNSLTVSVFWPAQEWSQDPELRYLCGSYDQLLSVRDNLRMRTIIDSDWYQSRWPLKFKIDQNTKTKIENEREGWRIATSVGGRGTGEHPNRKLIDDPHNVKRSLSPVQRRDAITWFGLTMSSRGLGLNAATVVTMQRLHEEDLSGHIFEELNDHFVKLVLPMRYEPPAWVEVPGSDRKVPKPRMEPTPLGFQDPRTTPGQLLWPELFTPAKVEKLERELRATSGEFGVAGQLQQRPVPQAGGLIKREWFEIVDGIPSDEVIVARARGWDCAATEGGGDWTVGVLMAYCASGRVYIEDVLRGQWGEESFEGKGGILHQTAQMDGRKVRIREEQEGGSAGKKIIAAHAKLLTGFDYEGSVPRGDKAARNKPFRAAASQHNVKLLRASWNREYLRVLTSFPNGTVDDDVDASSIAFNEVTLSNVAGPGRVIALGGV